MYSAINEFRLPSRSPTGPQRAGVRPEPIALARCLSLLLQSCCPPPPLVVALRAVWLTASRRGGSARPKQARRRRPSPPVSVGAAPDRPGPPPDGPGPRPPPRKSLRRKPTTPVPRTPRRGGARGGVTDFPTAPRTPQRGGARGGVVAPVLTRRAPGAPPEYFQKKWRWGITHPMSWPELVIGVISVLLAWLAPSPKFGRKNR